MIFFGSKGKSISGHVIEGLQCPNCENEQFITFGLLRYFHLYWIPTFITSKKVGIECTHCKKTLIGKELPNDLAKQIKNTVYNPKNTLPMFSGLIIIACLALTLSYSLQQNGLQEVAYIEQPVINDLYIVNFTKIFTEADPKYKYGLIRIKQISVNRVTFQVSQVAYNKASGVRKDIEENKALADSYYDDEPLSFDIKQLKLMKDSGAIYSIERL
ncbi:hypothetical protein [Agarivorans sp. QJM3NY_33]|uniref:hypothetical protein n=1 Tax=Agarivorans sp. QJM3NY_33 TaxID=3421432 RepID=UPI003D7C7D4D